MLNFFWQLVLHVSYSVVGADSRQKARLIVQAYDILPIDLIRDTFPQILPDYLRPSPVSYLILVVKHVIIRNFYENVALYFRFIWSNIGNYYLIVITFMGVSQLKNKFN